MQWPCANIRERAGVAAPQVPRLGWLYVGRIAEDKSFLPGLAIDPDRTKFNGGKLTELQIKADAILLGNGDECVRTAIEDFHPRTAEEKESIEFLLSPNSKSSLEVVSTMECPSMGGGKWVYAKILVPKEDVKFVKFVDLLKR